MGQVNSAQVNIIVAAAAKYTTRCKCRNKSNDYSTCKFSFLNGSGSYDPDGTITAYNWVTVSGPGSITINNSNTATPSVMGLQARSLYFPTYGY